MPKKYKFSYIFNMPLGNGKVFRRSGEIKGTSEKNVRETLLEHNPHCTIKEVKPLITKLTGSDSAFRCSF